MIQFEALDRQPVARQDEVRLDDLHTFEPMAGSLERELAHTGAESTKELWPLLVELGRDPADYKGEQQSEFSRVQEETMIRDVGRTSRQEEGRAGCDQPRRVEGAIQDGHLQIDEVEVDVKEFLKKGQGKVRTSSSDG